MRLASTTAFLAGLVVFQGQMSTRAAEAEAESHGTSYLTTYSHHIEKGEFEIMLMNDFTRPSRTRQDEGQGDYFSHMLEIEYHFTNQLAGEFMVEWFEDIDSDERKFTGARYEVRYRLWEEEVPLNPTIYFEYEDLDPKTRYKMEVSGWIDPPYEETGGEPSREAILESRLILSQDVGRWNLALNWINETDLHKGGETAFGYALGTQYGFHSGHEEHGGHKEHHGDHHEDHTVRPALFRLASAGVELVGALGDTEDFGLQPARQEHYLQPSLAFHLGEHQMLHLGVAIGLTENSDDIFRLNWGWEF